MSLSPICGLLKISQLIKRNFGQFLEMCFLLDLTHPCRGLVISIDTKKKSGFSFFQNLSSDLCASTWHLPLGTVFMVSFCQKHNHKFRVCLYTFALLILIPCQATKTLENIYLSSYHSSLVGKILSHPKVNDQREAHNVRNPTAPMLLLQVALESLRNLVGGGSGASNC